MCVPILNYDAIILNSYSQFGLRGRAPRGVTGELSPASVYVSLLPVVEACVVVAVPGRVGEVRVAADEPEAVDLDPGVLARRLDAPATVKAILEQGGRVVLRGRARAWDCFRLATGFTALSPRC